MEKLKIRVTKEGEIIVDFDQTEQVIIKKYIELFEEVIGPVREIPVTDSDMRPAAVKIIDQEREKITEEEKSKKKRRLK